MRTIPERKTRRQEKPPENRVPEHLSDLIYRSFNEMAHRSRLTEGTAVFANRMIREESFNREELLAIRAIINGDEPTAELSGEILGGDNTLIWIERILNPS